MTSKTIETEPSPVRRSIAVIGLFAAALALARCDDAGPIGTGTDVAFVGVYAAATVPVDGALGAITLEAPDGESRNLVLEGAGLTLALRDDGSTSGELFVPRLEGIDLAVPVDVELTGRWRIDDGEVRLDLEADVFLVDLGLVLEDDALTGGAMFGDVGVRVLLPRVVGFGDPLAGPVPDAGLDGLVFEADLGVGQVLPIDPPQRLIVGRMTIENRAEAPASFEAGGCPVFLVATNEDGRVWRQRDHVACVAIARRITIEPGASVELVTPRATSAGIVAGTGEGGRHRLEVVLHRPGGSHVVVEAGEIEL